MFLFSHCPASSLSNDFGNSARIKSFKPAVLSCTTCDILTEFQQFNLTVLHVQCNKMKPFWAKFVWWVAKLHKTPRRRRISKERARANRKWKRFRSDDRGTRDDSDCAIPNSSLKLVSWTWNNNNPRKKKDWTSWRVSPDPGIQFHFRFLATLEWSCRCFARENLSVISSWDDEMFICGFRLRMLLLLNSRLAMLWPNGKLETESKFVELCALSWNGWW